MFIQIKTKDHGIYKSVELTDSKEKLINFIKEIVNGDYMNISLTEESPSVTHFFSKEVLMSSIITLVE